MPKSANSAREITSGRSPGRSRNWVIVPIARPPSDGIGNSGANCQSARCNPNPTRQRGEPRSWSSLTRRVRIELATSLPNALMPPSSSYYQLLDFGDGRKLERFGDYILDRPAPAAIDAPRANLAMWKEAHARYDRSEGDRGV